MVFGIKTIKSAVESFISGHVLQQTPVYKRNQFLEQIIDKYGPFLMKI